MFGIGMQELVVFLIICLVLFGSSRIPDLARSLGKSITEFKKGVKGIEDEVENESKRSEDKTT